MSEWKEILLGDYAKFNYGKLPIKKLFGKGTFPIFTGYRYFESYPECNCKKGDLIVVARGVGGTGDVKLIKEDCFLTNLSIKIELNKNEIINPFLFYNFLVDNLLYLDSGSAQSQITINDLTKVRIKIPPIPEQELIAEVLSSIDDKINLLHRNNKTLEQLAETLFRQWFVVEADDSWDEILLGELIEIKGGFSYKGEFIGNGDALLLGMGCVSYNNRFLLSGARPYSGECPEKYLVNPGDIVIATRQQSDNLPILGFPAIVPTEFQNKKVIVGANLYRVINKSKISNYLIYQLLRTIEYRNHIIASAKGSTVRMITKDSIESFAIILPPMEVINKLEKVLTPINEKAISISKQIGTLTQLRDTLLPKLMTGSVRVIN